MKKNGKSKKIAFCGVMGAVMLLLMLLGNIIPVATYAVPCLASVLMMVTLEECGEASAWTLYAAVSILGLIVIADKELILLFILLMGYYPMLKRRIDRLRHAPVRLIIKLCIFAAAIALMYFILLVLFPVGDIVEEFAGMGTAMTIVLAAVGLLTFILLDVLLVRLKRIYLNKLRPKLIKGARN